MDDKDPTSVIKMIEDLRSGTESYQKQRRKTGSATLRLSGTSYTPSLFADEEGCTISPKRARLEESSNSVLNKSGGESTASSPWEQRRLQGEVVSLRARLSHRDAMIEQLHKVHREMEEIFEKEKSFLRMQVEEDKRTIDQLEVRLDVARRTIQDARELQAAAEKELHQVKTSMEQKHLLLMNENAKLKDDLKRVDSQEKAPSPISNTSENSDAQLKLTAAEARISQLEEKLKEHRAMQQDLELKNVELQNMRIKMEKLESERSLWEEGKQLAGRAAKACDLEKELNAARETIAMLKISVRGKLLLEEQMASMTMRLEHMEKLEQQVATLEAEQSELTRRLSEYESIGITGGPSALKRELNRLQQAEVVLKAEEGQLRSKLDASRREVQNLSQACDEAKKLAEEEKSSKEKLNKLISRLQKKMILVSRERDSYRQQLDLYEKEMTVDCSRVMTERIPALERAVEGYRELVARLETDLEATESGTRKDECNRLREEIERLKGELEHRALKGDFNCNARVLHFTMNPAAIAEQQAEEKQKALLREVEELRAKVAAGNSAGTSTSSLQAQEIEELKQTHQIKVTRLKEAFKVSSQEFRQACYRLFGWRIDRTKEGRYKLSSQYAESPDDFLFFTIGDERVDLLETAFSATLGPLIEEHLQRHNSVPMFLSAVQSELFAQQTVTSVVS